MSIERLDFDNLAEADLDELVQLQVPEGLRLDFKRALYGNNDADRREALKDISALANAHGGHLVIGVDEAGGVATAVPGIGGANPDTEILRLDQMARAGIEPRIEGMRIRAIQLASGNHCFVIRVPQSFYKPHRVSAQNWNRFWVRNSGGSHEASMNELRNLFVSSGNAVREIGRFRDERLAEIQAGTGRRPLEAGGRLVLHIVPLASVTDPSFHVDLKDVRSLWSVFVPIGATGFTPRINLSGFVNERGGDRNFGYTQVFRNGSVEATKANIVSEPRDSGRVIWGGDFETKLFGVLPNYLNALRDLGVPPPLVLLLTLEGVDGAVYFVGDQVDPAPPIDRNVVHLPSCLIEAYGTDADYHRALRPAIDALWNASGHPVARSFDADGRWTAHGR